MHGCPRKLELELFKAAMAEDTVMIVRLLEAGADADAQNEGGQTALELAATRGKLRSLFVRASGHLQPCMTEIYLHIVARMANYMDTHPYIQHM